MTPQEIAKEFFPDADDEYLEHVIWARTGFPSFFRREESVEDGMRRQLAEYKEALKRGVPLCEYCNNDILPNKTMCAKCGEALTPTGDGKK